MDYLINGGRIKVLNMNAKKIFFVLKNYKKNQLGAEKAQYYVSQYFIKYTNWKVVICCKDIEEKEKTNLEQYSNVKLIVIKNNFYLKLPFYLYKENPEYFFSWRWEYNLLVSLACKFKKIKNICFNHCFIFREMEMANPNVTKLYMLLYSFFCKITFLKFVNKIFVPSHQLKDYLSENISYKLKNKIIVQYNGLEDNLIKRKYLKEYKKIDTKNILYVGGFQKRKGIFNLLKIAKQNPDINFYVYGMLETAYKNKILSVIKNKNIKNILIKGFSNNIRQEYKKFDIFIFPSELDSFPFSILEAMKYGLIIISTNVGELKYILKDGYNCFIFDDKNFDFSKLNNYNLKEISKNAQKDFKAKFTLKIYKNILDNLMNLT